MAWFAVSLILPVWAAYVLVAYCDREARNDVATRFFRICLATGIGIGISSCTYFLWLFFVGVPGKTYHACELAVFAAAGLFGWVLLRVCTLGALPTVVAAFLTTAGQTFRSAPNSPGIPGQTEMSSC